MFFKEFGRNVVEFGVTFQIMTANNVESGGHILFFVVFSFFENTTYCCRARRLSVGPSVRPSVVCGNNFFSR